MAMQHDISDVPMDQTTFTVASDFEDFVPTKTVGGHAVTVGCIASPPAVSGRSHRLTADAPCPTDDASVFALPTPRSASPDAVPDVGGSPDPFLEAQPEPASWHLALDTRFAPEVQTALEQAAAEFALPPALVKAVCLVESSGNPWATRFESGYRWLWHVLGKHPNTTQGKTPPSSFPAYPGVSGLTEWAGQKTSWGLMQVMGAVARERGFELPFLAALCDPFLGAHYGCKHLKHVFNKYHHRYGFAGVLAAYNSGRPTSERGLAYAEHVTSHLQTI